MTLEPLLLALLVASGSAVLLAARLDRWRDHLALTLPAGTALLACVSLVLFVVPVHYSAGRALVVTLAVGGALLALRLGSVDRQVWSRLLLPPAVIAVSMVPISLVLRRLRFTRVTADSFEYLQSGGVAQAVGGPFDDVYLLVNRQFLGPIVHNLAAVGDEWFLVSIAPLFFFSLLATLWWLVAADRSPQRVSADVAIAVVAVALLLATTNRVVFHAFYVNTHLFVGVYMLQIGGLGWLLREGRIDRRAIGVVALFIAPVVVARPEGALLLLLLLTAFMIAGVEQAQLRLLALSFVGAVILWWAIGLGPLAGLGPTSPAAAAVAAGLAFALLVRLSGMPTTGPWLRARAAPMVHGALWVALGMAVGVAGTTRLTESVAATWENLRGEGLWGALPVALVAALLLSMAIGRPRGPRILFLFPAAGFVPLMFLLAYVRDGDYRVGPGDSLNRAWMHVVPLVVAYLLLVVADRAEEHADRPDRPRVTGRALGSAGPPA